jgi:hypothetical protein
MLLNGLGYPARDKEKASVGSRYCYHGHSIKYPSISEEAHTAVGREARIHHYMRTSQINTFQDECLPTPNRF